MTAVAGALVIGGAAVLLLTGGMSKIADRPSFERALANIPIIKDAIEFFSVVVPLVELALGALLLVGSRLALPVVAAALLFASFAVASLIRPMGPSGDCGCGPFVPKAARSRAVSSACMAMALVAVTVAFDDQSRTDRVLAAGSCLVAFMTVRTLVGSVKAVKQFRAGVLGER